MPGQFPPLAGSGYVTGDPERLALILLHGVEGPLTVQGAHYHTAMPGWHAQLDDQDLAAIATFIRQSWGNAASPVPPELFTRLRAESDPAPMTAETLGEE